MRSCESSLEIDRGLLGLPTDESGKEVNVHLGSRAFSCCNKVFYRECHSCSKIISFFHRRGN